jgi:hypothetical protein
VQLASSSDPLGTTEILVSLNFSNGTQLDQFLSELSNPASPEYHHYLTHSQFDSEFGGDPAVYGSLVGYFESFGVTDLSTHPDRLTISFQATSSQITSMFHTHLGAYLSSTDQPYFAPVSAPQLPSVVAPYVAEVQGLSNYSEYLNHADSEIVTQQILSSVGTTLTGTSSFASDSLPVSPGGSINPFSPTTLNGLTFDQPVHEGSAGADCSISTCGQMMFGSDLQVTYNETGLFAKYGYPVNATVVALLWSDTVNKGSSGDDGNSFCSSATSGDYAWDFFMPDVTTYWNYTLPGSEPMPRAVSMPLTGSSSYYYPSTSPGNQGYSASCDSGEAEGENTLDVAMEGSMAPGANVFQVFGQGTSTTTLTTGFSDILSPTSSEFSTTGGFDTSTNLADLSNASVIANSWGSSGSLGTAWNNDLKEAQALGITVLGATGDGGGNSIAPPAEAAYNTYGDVAVGGTTLVVNPTTLARTPNHLFSTSTPYNGTGGGEIVWYEPSGTVDGFSSTYGTTGGVAASSSYYAPTWQNSSTDAHSVITSITSSGYGRGEPDVSSIANDTVIDVDLGEYSYNITCIVVPTSCTQVSKSGDGVEVEYTYIIGTSISVQVTGGILGTINYVLHKAGQTRVGFIDPAVYSAGQLESSGDLTLHSFFGITMYHNAEPQTTYGAFSNGGWDADDGWGAIDAGNYTQNTMTYAITFTEGGLPSGTSWSVSLTPKVGDAGCTVSGSTCANSVTTASTVSAIVFPEPYGSYSYSIGSEAGYSSSPSSGTVSVSGADVNQGITFVSLLPAPPTGLAATALSSTAVELSWTNPSGTLTDNIIYGYDGAGCSGSPFWVWNLGSVGTSGVWLYLSPSTTYSWEVTAVSSVGASLPSNCASATTLTPPSAPTGLTATPASSTSVDLSWTNPSGTLTDNIIYGYDGAGCSGSPFWVWNLGSVGTSGVWLYLSPSTTYSWEVTAVSSVGASLPSNCASATTLTPPSAPTGLTATPASSTSVDLSWTNPSGTLTDNRVYGYDGAGCSGSPFYVWNLGTAVRSAVSSYLLRSTALPSLR